MQNSTLFIETALGSALLIYSRHGNCPWCLPHKGLDRHRIYAETNISLWEKSNQWVCLPWPPPESIKTMESSPRHQVVVVSSWCHSRGEAALKVSIGNGGTMECCSQGLATSPVLPKGYAVSKGEAVFKIQKGKLNLTRCKCLCSVCSLGLGDENVSLFVYSYWAPW